jgi:myo-inositol 2-dehydrogenase/D-chiro-inositol 1-dehydrogenase
MKPVKIGMVGLGRLGFIHAENIAFHLKNVTLEAVCSVRPEELRKAQEGLSVTVANCYSDFQTMLDDAMIDAVVIASPSDLHCSQAIAALEAGLHVFCEKPLGVTLEECRNVETIASQFPDKVIMLGFMRRYDPSYVYAKEKIDAGYIGKPVLLRCYSVDPDATMPGFLEYLPHSAGQFLDMAIHDIDLARWLLKSEPKSIYAIGGSYVYPQFEEYHDGDNVSALMQFENETMVFIMAGRTAPHGYNVETEIIGTKATIRIGSVPQKNLVELLDSDGVRRECVQSFSERFDQAFKDEIQEFANCILENRKPAITVPDGTRATEIALLATDSFRKNELIRLQNLTV